MKIRLYCITCKRSDITYEDQVEEACKGGADAVQFRDKSLSAREILEVGKHLKSNCKKHNVPFILNDRPDLALALDADGIHLGPDDIPVAWARQIIGGRKLIGYTVSSLGQALAAAKEGVQFLTVGPIFEASAKSDKDERGVDIIRLIKERVKVPVIAQGGINMGNVSEAIEAGADGIAVARSVCGSRMISQSAAEIKQKILQVLEPPKNDAY